MAERKPLVLLDDGAEGQLPAGDSLDGFIPHERIVRGRSATASAIVVEGDNGGDYNQGLRLNRFKTGSSYYWSGIVFGGKQGETQSVDPAGYDATTPTPTATAGNATWWAASNSSGDFTISQTAAGLPVSGVLYMKRSGECYLGSSYSINAPLVLSATDLGIPASADAAAFIYSPGSSQLMLTRLGNLVTLNGYVNVKAVAPTTNMIIELAIPNAHLPKSYRKPFTMINASFDVATSPNVSQIASLYFVNPSSDNGVSSPCLRTTPFAAGAYTELFFDSTWMVMS